MFAFGNRRARGAALRQSPPSDPSIMAVSSAARCQLASGPSALLIGATGGGSSAPFARYAARHESPPSALPHRSVMCHGTNRILYIDKLAERAVQSAQTRSRPRRDGDGKQARLSRIGGRLCTKETKHADTVSTDDHSSTGGKTESSNRAVRRSPIIDGAFDAKRRQTTFGGPVCVADC